MRAAIDAVVLVASAGGLPALRTVLGGLPRDFPAAVLVLQHLGVRAPSTLPKLLQEHTPLDVAWASDGDLLLPGHVYVATATHQLFVAGGKAISVAIPARDSAIRPSGDFLLASVALDYRTRALAVVLTGAGSDGMRGFQAVRLLGGVTVAESEETCAVYGMSKGVIDAGLADLVLPVGDIAPAIVLLMAGPDGPGANWKMRPRS